MTPETYAKVMNAAGTAALAGIPLADAHGGGIYVPPSNLVPPGFVTPSPQQPSLPTGPVPGPVPKKPVPVPEPASAALLVAALAALAAIRMKRTR